MLPRARARKALTYCGNRILSVETKSGSSATGKNLRRINLRGATVLPGFVDAHTHFQFFAQSLDRVNLADALSLGEALATIKSRARKLKQSEWLFGEALDVSRWSPCRLPTAAELDSATPGRPAAIYYKDQHTLCANSLALKLAGINASTRNPRGGHIDRLSDGAPSGILRENSAIELVLKLIPAPTKSEFTKLYNRALESAHSRGVTGVHSFDRAPGVFEFFRDRVDKRQPGLRVNYYIPFEELDNSDVVKNHQLSDDYWLTVSGVKIFADGSLGSKTALMHSNYLGEPDQYGVEVTTLAEMKKIIRRAKALGWPCAIHAIGDKAVTNVINALADIPAPDGKRHRIEHLQIMRRSDLPELKRSKAVASMQPSHLPGDVEAIARNWGKLRGRNAYLFRTFLDCGIPLAFGSDVPIEPLDPLGGIYDSAARRCKSTGAILNKFERITAWEAARAFTYGAAFAVSQENRRGVLAPGYHADMVILDCDLRTASAKLLKAARVLATIIGGKCVYSDGTLSLEKEI